MAFKNRILRHDGGGIDLADADLIKTPSWFLMYAKKQNIETVPLDLTAVCDKIGIQIVYQTLGQLDGFDIAGILSSNDNRWSMYINKKYGHTWQRFIIAHELGHYFLHRQDRSIFTDSVFFRAVYCTEEQKLEWQANEFAASILMPRDVVARLVDEGSDWQTLADTFQVSMLVMRYQLERTGLFAKVLKKELTQPLVYSSYKPN